MDKKDKVVLRKIKESGNYGMLLKLNRIIPGLFKYQSLFKIYNAIRNPKMFNIERENMLFDDFLKNNGIFFVF